MTSPAVTTRRTRNLLRAPAGAVLGRSVLGSGRTALAALVAAVVIGILGMHALASHGTPAATAMPDAPTSPVATGMTMHAQSPTLDAVAATATGDSRAYAATHHAEQTPTGTSADAGSGHDMANMAMLCVAMLAAAALTLLVLLAVGILRPLLPAAFAPAAVHARALHLVRGTGPPHEWQFSVIRC